MNSASCEGGNFPASHCGVMQNIRMLKKMLASFLLSINKSLSNKLACHKLVLLLVNSLLLKENGLPLRSSNH